MENLQQRKLTTDQRYCLLLQGNNTGPLEEEPLEDRRRDQEDKSSCKNRSGIGIRLALLSANYLELAKRVCA